MKRVKTKFMVKKVHFEKIADLVEIKTVLK